MGGTGPGTQQALHKYLMSKSARQSAFPALLPWTIRAIRGGGQTCREDHLAAGGACLGEGGGTEELNRAGCWAALGNGCTCSRTVSCLDYDCFN